MRVHVDKSLPALIDRVKSITLDGVVQKNVVAADDEAGLVTRILTDEEAAEQGVVTDGRRWPEKTYHGKVVIELEGVS